MENLTGVRQGPVRYSDPKLKNQPEFGNPEIMDEVCAEIIGIFGEYSLAGMDPKTGGWDWGEVREKWASKVWPAIPFLFNIAIAAGLLHDARL